MINIDSRNLVITVFDPETDRKFFGPRFCTGGYICRVTEKGTGKILTTGPTWGNGFVPFHGEGMPETFHRIPLPLKGENCHLIPGIGKCDLDGDRIIEHADWTAEVEESRAVFETVHRAGGYDFTLRRTVKTKGRRVVSETEIVNRGPELIPVCWYPHPFLPPVKPGCVMYEVSPNASFTSPTGYFSMEKGRIRRVPGVDQELSFQPMTVHGAERTEVLFHTAAGIDVTMKTDYRSEWVPVWCNDVTCSAEPYFETTVWAGSSRKWSVEYEFLI